MTYQHGKAIQGGTPLTPQELDTLAQDQIEALRSTLKRFAPRRKSKDVLNQRLAEEMRLVQRMLELLEDEARRRGDNRTAKSVERAEDALSDIAEIVEADDRCEAMGDIDETMARRLKRRSIEGRDGPCDELSEDGERAALTRLTAAGF